MGRRYLYSKRPKRACRDELQRQSERRQSLDQIWKAIVSETRNTISVAGAHATCGSAREPWRPVISFVRTSNSFPVPYLTLPYLPEFAVSGTPASHYFLRPSYRCPTTPRPPLISAELASRLVWCSIGLKRVMKRIVLLQYGPTVYRHFTSEWQ